MLLWLVLSCCVDPNVLVLNYDFIRESRRGFRSTMAFIVRLRNVNCGLEFGRVELIDVIVGDWLHVQYMY